MTSLLDVSPVRKKWSTVLCAISVEHMACKCPCRMILGQPLGQRFRPLAALVQLGEQPARGLFEGHVVPCAAFRPEELPVVHRCAQSVQAHTTFESEKEEVTLVTHHPRLLILCVCDPGRRRWREHTDSPHRSLRATCSTAHEAHVGQDQSMLLLRC